MLLLMRELRWDVKDRVVEEEISLPLGGLVGFDEDMVGGRSWGRRRERKWCVWTRVMDGFHVALLQ